MHRLDRQFAPSQFSSMPHPRHTRGETWPVCGVQKLGASSTVEITVIRLWLVLSRKVVDAEVAPLEALAVVSHQAVDFRGTVELRCPRFGKKAGLMRSAASAVARAAQLGARPSN